MRRLSHLIILLSLAALSFLLVSCGSQTSTSDTKSDEKSVLPGKWSLQARLVDGIETPANNRILEITFTKEGTFRANFRGDESQKWIRAGLGRYAYAPPLLTLYWETGPSVTLLVQELSPDRIRLHHGRVTIPMKDQEPDEIFVRRQVEKGPSK
jgi:hypothetical protein